MTSNNQNKISLIIAVYNTETFLKKCVDSTLKQSYKNLEIILVDDGSTDTCPAICDEYKKNDKRVNVIHKKNGGQGSARNMALEKSTGEWIGFVDSDDWIAEDMYEYLLEIALKEDADIVECGWYKLDTNNRVEYETEEKYYSLSNDAAMHSLVYGTKGLNTSVCNKLFKRDCIGSYHFPEVRAYEDDEWIHKVVWSATKIIITGTPKYYYLSRINSTMTANFNINKLALLSVQRNICDFLHENAPHYFNKAQKTLCSKQFYIISCLLKNPALDKDKIFVTRIEHSIYNSYNSFMKNPEMGRNRFILWVYRFLPVLGRVVIISKF